MQEDAGLYRKLQGLPYPLHEHYGSHGVGVVSEQFLECC